MIDFIRHNDSRESLQVGFHSEVQDRLQKLASLLKMWNDSSVYQPLDFESIEISKPDSQKEGMILEISYGLKVYIGLERHKSFKPLDVILNILKESQVEELIEEKNFFSFREMSESYLQSYQFPIKIENQKYFSEKVITIH